MTARIEAVAGRYAHLTLDGKPHRLYFEEADRGSPSFASTPPAPTGASSAPC